jgi:hypothetical protein
MCVDADPTSSVRSRSWMQNRVFCFSTGTFAALKAVQLAVRGCAPTMTTTELIPALSKSWPRRTAVRRAVTALAFAGLVATGCSHKAHMTTPTTVTPITVATGSGTIQGTVRVLNSVACWQEPGFPVRVELLSSGRMVGAGQVQPHSQLVFVEPSGTYALAVPAIKGCSGTAMVRSHAVSRVNATCVPCPAS